MFFKSNLRSSVTSSSSNDATMQEKSNIDVNLSQRVTRKKVSYFVIHHRIITGFVIDPKTSVLMGFGELAVSKFDNQTFSVFSQ